MRIGIPKERREHELRVAASPDTVKRYKGFCQRSCQQVSPG